MATLLDDSRPNITVTNTSTETDVYVVTIPGGTLSTNKIVYMKLLGKKVKNGGGADSDMRIRVYYGTTLLAAFHPMNVGSDVAAGVAIEIEVNLYGNGATNAQAAQVFVKGVQDYGTPGTALDGTTWLRAGREEATEDSTGDLDLKVTWQQAAVTQHSFTSEHGVTLAV